MTYNLKSQLNISEGFYNLIFIKNGIRTYASNGSNKVEFLFINENDSYRKIINPLISTGNCQFTVIKDFEFTINEIISISNFSFEQAVDYYLEMLIIADYHMTLTYLHLCQYHFEKEQLKYIKNHPLLKIVSYTDEIGTHESVQVHILFKYKRININAEQLPKEKLYMLTIATNIIYLNENVYFNSNLHVYQAVINNYLGSIKNQLSYDGFYQKETQKYIDNADDFYQKLAEDLNKNKLNPDITFEP
jgi:hypothetical protein